MLLERNSLVITGAAASEIVHEIYSNTFSKNQMLLYVSAMKRNKETTHGGIDLKYEPQSK